MTWKHELSVQAQSIIQSPKVAGIVSGGTFATGSATWLDWIPGEIGFYASVFGMGLSAVLIYNNIKGGILKRQIDRAEFEKLQLEISNLKGSDQVVDGKLQRRSSDRDN